MRVIAIRSVCASALALVLGLGLVFHVALPARACTCMAPDPYGGLVEADGAFIGTLTATDRGLPVTDTGTLVDNEFDVEAALKGDIGEVVTVKSAADGAACGFEMPIGARVGILMDRVDDEWHGNLCWTLDADALLAASQGPPEPVSVGPPHVIASVYMGNAGLVALDVDGQVVGYGSGRPAWLMSACPDHTSFIGIGDGTTVRSWSFADLTQVSEIDLGDSAAGGFYTLACTGPEEFYALSATGDASDLPHLVLSHAIGGHVEFVSEDVESIVQSKDGLLAVGSDGVISRVDPESSALVPITRSIGDLQGKLATANPSPDGRYLALSTVDWNRQPIEVAVVVADLVTGEAAHRETDCDVYPGWVGENHIVMSDCTSGRFAVYTTELELVGRGQDPWPSGYPGTAIDETGTVYIATERGVDRIHPGAEVEEPWAALATHPNQVMVVPPRARDVWVGSDFVPRPPTEVDPLAIDDRGPGDTIVPITVAPAAGTSIWLVGGALLVVAAVSWLIMRRPDETIRTE
jgi:hypothetical protein